MLVTVELALAIIVLCAAGLLIKSLATVLTSSRASIRPTSDDAGVAAAERYLRAAGARGFLPRLANGVEGLPGIRRWAPSAICR